MSKADKRWWYRIVADNLVETNYLVYASSEEAACQPFYGKLKVTYSGRASWRSMCQLTGCIKPLDSDYSDFATGFLIFNHNNLVTILHPTLAERIV